MPSIQALALGTLVDADGTPNFTGTFQVSQSVSGVKILTRYSPGTTYVVINTGIAETLKPNTVYFVEDAGVLTLPDYSTLKIGDEVEVWARAADFSIIPKVGQSINAEVDLSVYLPARDSRRFVYDGVDWSFDIHNKRTKRNVEVATTAQHQSDYVYSLSGSDAILTLPVPVNIPNGDFITVYNHTSLPAGRVLTVKPTSGATLDSVADRAVQVVGPGQYRVFMVFADEWVTVKGSRQIQEITGTATAKAIDYTATSTLTLNLPAIASHPVGRGLDAMITVTPTGAAVVTITPASGEYINALAVDTSYVTSSAYTTVNIWKPTPSATAWCVS